MDDRQSVRLDPDDTVAAAQILAWVSRPHRPESAVKVLNHWYWLNWRKAGRPLPEAFDLALEKPGRIEGPFRKLEADCLAAFRAGAWAQSALLKAAPHHWFDSFDTGIRKLGERRANARGTAAGNEIRDIWSKRKAVAHMCLASANAVGGLHHERGWVGFGLSGTMLNPVWVAEAIEQSEVWARSLRRLPNPTPLVRFHRDSF